MIFFNNFLLYAGHIFQFSNLNFIIEMANITNDCLVFHFAHVLGSDDIFVSGCSHKNISRLESILNGGDLESSHACLKGTNWVNLRNHDASFLIKERISRTFAYITKSTNHGDFTRDHNIHSTLDTVY